MHFRLSYNIMSVCLIDHGLYRADSAACINYKETAMSDLNNSNPTPPPESQAKLDKAAEESRKLDTPQRTNDSTIDPEKPVDDILKGFHGG
jgi:hypothetical protein